MAKTCTDFILIQSLEGLTCLPSVRRQGGKTKEAEIQDQEEWEWVSAQSGFALAKAGDTNGRGVGLFW